MKKGFFFDSSPITMIIMLCFVMVSSVTISMALGMLIASFVLGVPINDLANIVYNDDSMQHLNLVRYLQILTNISFFTIPALIAAYLFSGNAVKYLGLRQGAKLKWFIATLLVMLTAIPAINLLLMLNEMIVFPESLAGLESWLMKYEDNAQQTTKLFLNVDTLGGLFFNIFMMAILPAIGEELIFRGLLHKIFVKWTGNVHVAIIITGLLFSMMHLQFYGLFPRWILGILFSYMMVWSGTIWVPILAHFVQNTLAIVVHYLIYKKMISDEVETIGASSSDIPLIIFATSLCAVTLWFMCKKWRMLKTN